MKTPQLLTAKILSSAFGVVSLIVVSSAQAAFVSVAPNTPESPGVLLGAGTSVLAGTVLASSANNFVGSVSGSTLSGTLRSMVVDTGSGYDFYYQVINTSTSGLNGGDDIFRLAIPGYGQGAFTVDATYRTDALAGLTGAPVAFTSTFVPNKGLDGSVYSADRDPALNTAEFNGGGAAFYFDSSQFFNLNVPGGPTTAPSNIDAGQNSNWLVLRTNYNDYTQTGVVSVLSAGGGTGQAGAFAPIPEPSTMLFGLAMISICANSRRRKNRAVQQA